MLTWDQLLRQINFWYWKKKQDQYTLLCSFPPVRLYSRSPSLSEVVRWNQNVNLGHMLGLKGAVAVLGHVHINADLLRPAQLLDQYQLPSLPVWSLHDKDASGVSAHDAKAQAVRPGAPRGGGGCHAEKRCRSLHVGGQRQVVEGHGLGSKVAGSAVHGARVSLTLTGGQKGSKY